MEHVKVVSFPGAQDSRSAPSPVVAVVPQTQEAPEHGRERTESVPVSRASDELRQAIDALSSRLRPGNTNLSFRVDVASNRVVVTIVDAESGAVLRQIPAEELMRVAQNLQQHPREHRGALLDERA